MRIKITKFTSFLKIEKVLKPQDLLNLYKEDGFVRSIAEILRPNISGRLQIKGLAGSFDAILSAAVFQLVRQNFLFILHDKEEAAYFQDDLQNLLGRKEVLFFPASYKRPYEYEEIENANVLDRAEILNRLIHKSGSGEVIVTYPEALSEKVIQKSALRKNTFSLRTGEETDIDLIEEMLVSYDFEKNDFVYEAGQFAIRGGILDIYSYAHDLPFRIELFGNEVESIRTFDPVSQLSRDHVKSVHIIPNVQTRLLDEEHQSFFKFLPGNTKIWIKDYKLTRDVIEKSFEKASGSFEEIIKKTFNTHVVSEPGELFDDGRTFEQMLERFQVVEFGHRFSGTNTRVFSFNISPQPSFHKNFEKIVENFESNRDQGVRNLIIAESYHQLEQLRAIFEEIDSGIVYDEVCMSLSQGFIDRENKIACFTDHQLFDRYHRYRVKEKYSKSKALTLKELKTLSPGDYVTHIDHGIGRFAGLVKIDHHGNKQEVLRLIYRDNDLLYVSVNALHKIAKYSGKDAAPPMLNKLGSPEWENKKKRVKRKVKDIAKDLISLYAKRKSAQGFQYTEDSYLQAELESSFIYEDTPDQAKATEEVKKDMQAPYPMDRLVCGDVGFGKTEVAIRAAFKAVADGKQVAVLVPTTILALQHYHTFSERLEKFPVDIEYLNRFKSAQNVKSVLQRLKEGKIDILIGTHRIVNKDVVFKDLGLLIVDEEQKFGVSVKEKLKKLRINVDVLTLTATPIPRTLHFSLMGARDLSIIATPPANRQPVTTEIHTFSKEVVRDAIRYEMRRGGQVFFVHNRVNDIEQIGDIIYKLVPEARIGIAHGQMDGRKLEKVMTRFIEGTCDVLLSTNIIESGLDIPNANTIIINQAHMFGLSDLHQMRGRVGRSNKKAFCYLLAPPAIHLTPEARKRLRTLEEFTELGDGLKVAMRDLDIRGAGNMLGAEQSGFINDLGFETYHKILDEAVQELKEEEFKELFKGETGFKPETLVPDCTIETDFEVLIPEDYVSNISERLQLYNELDNIESERELGKYLETVRDRFGIPPAPVLDLTKLVRLRWSAKKLGFENITIKNGVLKGQFVHAREDKFFNSEVFGDILAYVQAHPAACRLKEYRGRLLLIIDNIDQVDTATKIFNDILNLHTLQMQ